MGELIRLTNSERLLLDRRRWGFSQREYALFHNLSLREYQRAESGEKPLARSSVPRITELRASERCLIMRLRAGWTQARVAREAGWCRRWVMLMETGRAPCHELISFWES
jgi:hypothetical protein